jgi:uncharacterized surface protein with fasciclin (FAS1) repeats
MPSVRKILPFLLTLLFWTVGFWPSAAQQGVAQLRVANFSPDAPVLEVWLNGTRSDIQTLKPNEMSGWVQIVAGRHQIAFVPQGGTLADALVGPFNLELTNGSWSTVPVLGLNGAGSIYAIWITEDYPSPIPAGMTRLTVFNGIPGGSAVDLLAEDGRVLAQNVRFGRAANVDLPAGTHNLRFVTTGSTGGGLATGAVSLEANTYYLLGTVRRQSGGGLVLRSVAQTEVSGLLAAQPLPSATTAPITWTPTPEGPAPTADALALVTNTPQGTPPDFNAATETPTATPTVTLSPTPAGTPTPTRPPSEWMTIVDMVGTSPLLSISRRALDQVGLTQRVASGTFTFFVPTDDAWRNLVDNYPDLLPDADSIRRLMMYHLINERIKTADMFDQMTLLTTRGAFMRITRSGNTYMVDSRATIIVPDVEAVNGIIHVIDAVLVPPDMRPPEMRPVRPLG